MKQMEMNSKKYEENSAVVPQNLTLYKRNIPAIILMGFIMLTLGAIALLAVNELVKQFLVIGI